MFDEDDDGFSRRKKSGIAEADLDITPMIDVTFLLLIFFMVTSTMQGSPDRDIPTSKVGTAVSLSEMLQLVILAPKIAGGSPEVQLDGKPATLDEFRSTVLQRSAEGELEVMIMAEREVENGFVGEVESILAEVSNVKYHFAVQEKR
jgi:biopolymer transport protein ExbD